jgi:hypothetical protein
MAQKVRRALANGMILEANELRKIVNVTRNMRFVQLPKFDSVRKSLRDMTI